MGKAKKVDILGREFSTQSRAVAFFNDKKLSLLNRDPITSGDFFEALEDLYVRYCDNFKDWELNGRVVLAFSVRNEKRKNGDSWATHPCYKVHFSNDEVRPFSIEKAIKSIAQSV